MQFFERIRLSAHLKQRGVSSDDAAADKAQAGNGVGLSKADTKKHVVKKKELSDALKREKKFSHSIAEFTVVRKPTSSPVLDVEAPETAVTMKTVALPQPPPPPPPPPTKSVVILSMLEQEFAEAAASRRRIDVAADRACGNSPFCTNTSHKHAADSTALGRVEQRLRTSAWASTRRVLDEWHAVVPHYPFEACAPLLAAKQKTSRLGDRKMSDDEFLNGVRAGVIECLVLAQMRIFNTEVGNIIASNRDALTEIDAVCARQLSELTASAVAGGASAENFDAANDPAGIAVRQQAGAKRARMGALTIDRMRYLEMLTSEQLRKLLVEFNVPRLNVVHADLYQFMLTDNFASDSEHRVLQRIRHKLAQSQESGPFFDDATNAPFKPSEWRYQQPSTSKKRASSPSHSSPTVDTKRQRESAEHPTPPDSPSQPEPPPPPPSPPLPQPLVPAEFGEPLALCESQFALLEGCTACSSICVEVALVLSGAPGEAAELDVSERQYVERLVQWSGVVRRGISNWLERPRRRRDARNIAAYDSNELRDFEMPIEVLQHESMATMIAQRFRVFEFGGSMFDAPPSAPAVDDAERMHRLANPDLETALQLAEAEVPDPRQVLACTLTYHAHTVLVARHAYGWHVFDSAGSTIADRSVLFTVPSSRAIVARLLRYLFNVDPATQARPVDAEGHGLYEAYAMVALVRK